MRPLGVGDSLLLNASGDSPDPAQRVLAFPEPWLLEQVRVGERVILDDGKLVAVVEAARLDGLVCRVTQALKSPTRLRSGKGIAFPDSQLSLRQLGMPDEVALAPSGTPTAWACPSSARRRTWRGSASA